MLIYQFLLSVTLVILSPILFIKIVKELLCHELHSKRDCFFMFITFFAINLLSIIFVGSWIWVWSNYNGELDNGTCRNIKGDRGCGVGKDNISCTCHCGDFHLIIYGNSMEWSKFRQDILASLKFSVEWIRCFFRVFLPALSGLHWNS